ncbi:MAG TPA: hypothetical protein PLR18_00295 [bacterium]|nr:hypothetical protein [bacterium]
MACKLVIYGVIKNKSKSQLKEVGFSAKTKTSCHVPADIRPSISGYYQWQTWNCHQSRGNKKLSTGGGQ